MVTLSKNKIEKYIFWGAGILVFGLITALMFNTMNTVRLLTWNGIRGGLMPDLFESIWHAKCDNPYDYGAIYPPLCYMLLDFFNLFIDSGYTFEDRFKDIRVISTSYDGIFVAVIYSLIIFVLSSLMIYKYYNGQIKYKILLAVFFFGSAPYIYMYERGNTVIIALLLLAVFFSWYDSNEFLKVRIALICFVMAICLKIYPVICGFLLLFEKRYKLIIESIVYSFIIFLVPFLYFEDFSLVEQMVGNIRYLSSETVADERGFGYGFKISLQNTMLALNDRFNLGYFNYIDYFVYIHFGLLLISIFVLQDKKYRILSALLIMVLIPPFSWIYNAVYLYIPFLMFLSDESDEISLENYTIIILLFLCFAPLPYRYVFRGLDGVNKITLSTFVCSLSLILLAFVIEFNSIKSMVNRSCEFWNERICRKNREKI